MLKKFIVVAMAVLISASAMAGSKAKKSITGVVNINTATAAELSTLPGIGKSKADAIIAHRQTSPFKTTQDITKVKGIGQKKFAKIQPYLTVEGATTVKAVKSPSATPKSGQ